MKRLKNYYIIVNTLRYEKYRPYTPTIFGNW